MLQPTQGRTVGKIIVPAGAQRVSKAEQPLLLFATNDRCRSQAVCEDEREVLLVLSFSNRSLRDDCHHRWRGK